MSTHTKTILEPNLPDLMQNLKRDIFRSMNCVKIGEIKSFDATKKTAKIQIQFKHVREDGQIVSVSPLVDCPVFTLQGGGSAIEMPITAGDQCIILFSDRNIDSWFQTGGEGAPLNSRCHDLSDGIALVGLNSLANPLSGALASTFRLIYAGATLDLKSGIISLKSQANGAEVDLNGTLVSIKNPTANLLTLINGLIDAVAGASTVSGGPLTAGSIAAIQAYKVLFAGLLV